MIKNEETSRWECHSESFLEQTVYTARGLFFPVLIAVGVVVISVA